MSSGCTAIRVPDMCCVCKLNLQVFRLLVKSMQHALSAHCVLFVFALCVNCLHSEDFT